MARKLGAGDGPEAVRKLRIASTDDVLNAAADGEFDHVVGLTCEVAELVVSIAAGEPG